MSTYTMADLTVLYRAYHEHIEACPMCWNGAALVLCHHGLNLYSSFLEAERLVEGGR